MSQRALEFVETWVSENIKATGDEAEGVKPEGDKPEADNTAAATVLAAQCLKAAWAEGIPQSEIQEAFDDLAAFIAGEIEEANDRAAESEDAEEE
jgi:hypothetical protein